MTRKCLITIGDETFEKFHAVGSDEYKSCYICKQTLPLEHFDKRASGYCSFCRNVKDRDKYHSNIEFRKSFLLKCKRYQQSIREDPVQHAIRQYRVAEWSKKNRTILNIKQRERNHKLPPEKRKEKSLKIHHKIVYANYKALLEQYDYQCMICKKKLDPISKKYDSMACVDHCHASNSIRGILCKDCNSGLGYFRDKVENLRQAVRYLEAFSNDK